MPTRPSTEAKTQLATRLAEDQALDPERAGQLAERILAGPDDIAASAVAWSETGRMPAVPEVLGETPKTLSDRLEPSQVFTGLILLRTDPNRAREVLRRGLDRAPARAANLRQIEVSPAEAAPPAAEVTFASGERLGRRPARAERVHMRSRSGALLALAATVLLVLLVAFASAVGAGTTADAALGLSAAALLFALALWMRA